jgi:hypothetical protein
MPKRKYLKFLVIFILLLVAVFGVAIATNTQVRDAISGHLRDISDRFSDHQSISGEVIKEGDIDVNAKGQDPLHNSSGTWSLVKVGDELYLQSAENFMSSPGPDYHVYVSKNPSIKDNEQFGDDQIEVGRLTKPNGAAYYRLASKDPSAITSVLIWCKQFREYIGSADLLDVN